MAKITIDLEPLTNLYIGEADLIRALVKNASACEIAGADGVLFDSGREIDQARRRAIEVLTDSLNIGLAVKATSEEKHLSLLQDLKPTMVIIPYNREKRDYLAQAVTSMQVEHITVGLEIPLELDAVKEAAKLKADNIIVDCSGYCASRTLNAQIDELEKISKVAGLCSRMSLGMIANGPFLPHHLSRLSKSVAIDEYIAGLPFFSNSLIQGYERTIQAFRSALR